MDSADFVFNYFNDFSNDHHSFTSLNSEQLLHSLAIIFYWLSFLIFTSSL